MMQSLSPTPSADEILELLEMAHDCAHVPPHQAEKVHELAKCFFTTFSCPSPDTCDCFNQLKRSFTCHSDVNPQWTSLVQRVLTSDANEMTTHRRRIIFGILPRDYDAAKDFEAKEKFLQSRPMPFEEAAEALFLLKGTEEKPSLPSIRNPQDPTSNFSILKRNDSREKYQSFAKEVTQNCKLCWRELALLYQNLSIVRGDFPYFCNHFLIRTFDPSSPQILADFGDGIRCAEIKSQNLQCRSYALFEDDISILSLLEQKAPSYIAWRANKGAGCSIDTHTHTHLMPKESIPFPLLQRNLFTPLPGTNKVLVNANHTYIVAIVGDTAEEVALNLQKIKKQFPYPSDDGFMYDEQFGGFVAFYIPRPQEYAQCENPDWNPTWKVPFWEPLGILLERSETIAKSTTYEHVCQIVRSVTLQDDDQRKDLETFLMSA